MRRGKGCKASWRQLSRSCPGETDSGNRATHREPYGGRIPGTGRILCIRGVARGRHRHSPAFSNFPLRRSCRRLCRACRHFPHQAVGGRGENSGCIAGASPLDRALQPARSASTLSHPADTCRGPVRAVRPTVPYSFGRVREARSAQGIPDSRFFHEPTSRQDCPASHSSSSCERLEARAGLLPFSAYRRPSPQPTSSARAHRPRVLLPLHTRL